MKKNRALGIFYIITASLSFAVAFLLPPLIYEGGANPSQLAVLRAFLCLPFLALLAKREGASLKLPKPVLLFLIPVAIIGNSMTSLFINTGLELAEVGQTIAMHYANPVLVCLGSFLFFREPMGPVRIFSLLLLILGLVGFYVDAQLHASAAHPNSMLGLFFALLSAFTYAFFIIALGHGKSRGFSTTVVTFYVCMVTTVVVSIYTVMSGQWVAGSMSLKSWGLSLVFSVLCNVVGINLLQKSMQHLRPSTVSVLATSELVFSLILGILVHGESVHPLKLGAALLVLVAAILASVPPKEAGQKAEK